MCGLFQKPGASVHEVFRCIRAAGVELAEPALSARQALFGGRQQPFERLRSVAFDGVPVVVQTAVREDAEIELRRAAPLSAASGRPLIVPVSISASYKSQCCKAARTAFCVSKKDRRTAPANRSASMFSTKCHQVSMAECASGCPAVIYCGK